MTNKVDEGSAGVTFGGHKILPLTPRYLAQHHGKYAETIVAALKNPDIKNIALSGNYGVGKSSILDEVSRQLAGRVLELSLSTLAPIATARTDDGVPEQATTPTNRIQQEIVKQLLYREVPSKTTGSRFKRIEKFHLGRELTFAAIVGLTAAVLFVLTGWGVTVAKTFGLGDLALWVYPAVCLLAAGSVLTLRWLLHGRVHIKAFSAGPAAVTLDDRSVSYFDQYLDEIVYFFETSSSDIVLFEDIDRFNDPHIFETLRALNTLLNATPQIKRTIRFVYAIKDSIFDRIGFDKDRKDPSLPTIADPALAESARANRTKFFDLVIPVVPFISHHSASDVASQLLSGIEHDVDPALIDLAGRFVPDMRLLKNVRNEFVVFRDRIFSGAGAELDLRETELFAMMLYKSTHLTDFERLRLGKSNLDKLYQASRKIVDEVVQRLEEESQELRRKISRAANAPARSTQMGKRLIAHAERTARANGLTSVTDHFAVQNVQFDADAVAKPDFWRALAEAPKDSKLGWRSKPGHSLALPLIDLPAALGDSLELDEWASDEQSGLRAQLAELQAELGLVRGYDMRDLMARTDLQMEYEGEKEQSLADIAEAILERGLAFHLVRSGYISRSFTLYTSTFHGERVTSAAMNFLMHHYERNLPDAHFPLTSDDVKAVLREAGPGAPSDPALFNIAVLDHLLAGRSTTATEMVTALARLDDSSREFLQKYFDGGRHQQELAARLASATVSVLPLLVDDLALDDATRPELVSAALGNLSPGKKYRTGPAVQTYLQSNEAKLGVLRDEAVSAKAAASIARVFDGVELLIEDLAPLAPQVRNAFVDSNGYTVTRGNLLQALGADADLALDAIRSLNLGVYKYVLANLDEYLKAIRGYCDSSRSADGLVETLRDIADNDEVVIAEIVERSSEGSVVDDLATVPEVTWPALARFVRLKPSVANVQTYIESIGSIDEALANTLETVDALGGSSEADAATRETLALQILGAASLTESRRITLAKDLATDNYLEIDGVANLSGWMVGELLGRDLIEDSAESYNAIFGLGSDVRVGFIAASKEFVNFMTPELVDVEQVLVSEGVDMAVRDQMLAEAENYAARTDEDGRLEMARFALANQRELPIRVVGQLADDGAEPGIVTSLLESHLDSLEVELLFSILDKLGKPYSELTTVGYQQPRLANTAANRALLSALERHGIVSSTKLKDSSIRVYKFH